MPDTNTALREFLRVATLLADSLEKSKRQEIWTGDEDYPAPNSAEIRSDLHVNHSGEPVISPLRPDTLIPGPDLSENVGWED